MKHYNYLIITILFIFFAILTTMTYAQTLTIPTTSFQYPSGIAGKEVNFSINSNGWFTVNNLNMTAKVYGFNSFTVGVDVNDNGNFSINIRNNDATAKQLLLSLLINITPTMNVRWQGKDCVNGVCSTATSAWAKPEVIIDNRLNLDYGDIITTGYGVENVTVRPRLINITITNNLTTPSNEIAVIDPIFSTSSLGPIAIIVLNESSQCMVYCDNTAQDISMSCFHANGDTLRSEVDIDEQAGACDNFQQISGFAWERNGNISIMYYEASDQDITIINGNWSTMTNATTPKRDLDTTAGTVGASVSACKLNSTSGSYTWLDAGTSPEMIKTNVESPSVQIGTTLVASTGDLNSEDHTMIGSDCLTNITWAIGFSDTLGNRVMTRVINISGGTLRNHTRNFTVMTAADAQVGVARYNDTAYYIGILETGGGNDVSYAMYMNNGTRLFGNITVDNNVDVGASFMPLHMSALPNGNATIMFRDAVNGAAPGDSFTGIKIAFVTPFNYSQVIQYSNRASSYIALSRQLNISQMFCNNSIIYADDSGAWNGTNQNGGNWTGKCATATLTNSCTYTSGDFNINCADSCKITSTADLNQNKVRFYGSGTIDITGKIFDYSTLVNEGTACYVACRSPTGECFA